jgi:glycosyltransferase involved in cell wall biosynthesis
VDYSIPLPEWTKFKLKSIYKAIVKLRLNRILKTRLSSVDYCFDFGCYQLFDSVGFFPSKYKIFFPVDDFAHLTSDVRGSDIVLTVSKEIEKKFPIGTCHFINHGLSEEFEKKTIVEFGDKVPWETSSNILLKFIDFHLFEKLIRGNPESEFHFFGSHDPNSLNEIQFKWLTFLKGAKNVVFHGWVDSKQLVELYQKMDLFILCYKPDNLNYHGENSHKILEYLSTGKVIVSSHISLYDKTGLLEMDNVQGDQLVHLFKRVIGNLVVYNSIEKMQQRRAFALDNTYTRQLSRIEHLINES